MDELEPASIDAVSDTSQPPPFLRDQPHQYHTLSLPPITGLCRSVRIRTQRRDDQHKALPLVSPYHRPQRERKKTETIGMLAALDQGEEPNHYRDAVFLSRETPEWIAACTKEYGTLIKTGTWNLVLLPLDHQSRWTFKIKPVLKTRGGRSSRLAWWLRAFLKFQESITTRLKYSHQSSSTTHYGCY